MALMRAPSPLNLLSVLLLVYGSTCAAEDAAVYKKLVGTPASFFGKVDKGGMLPLHYWSQDHFNRSHAAKFMSWLDSSVSNKTVAPKVPPLTHACGVWVNHAYKVIFIRNKKAASTSIVWAMGNPCRDKKSKTCMEKVTSASSFTRVGTTPEKAWKDYLVFGVARNPWARAASGFDYAAIAHAKENCYEQPSFKQFCQDPMVLGKQCYLHQQCCFGYVGKIIHLEPAARCFMTEDNKPVVDYVVRYEHLQEDFAEVINVVNKGRLPEVKPLKGELGFQTVGIKAQHLKGKAKTDADKVDWDNVESSSRHAAKYQKCGVDCVKGIAEFYKEDVDFFKYDSAGLLDP